MLTFRASLDRARRSGDRVCRRVSPVASSLSPSDSASAKVPDVVDAGDVEFPAAVGSQHGVVLDSALQDYSRFMMAALEKVEPSGVAPLVHVYSSVINGCFSVACASAPGAAVSIISSASGVSVRSGSWAGAKLAAVSGAGSPVQHASRRVSMDDVGAASSPGLCYLKFVARGCRTAARRCLGSWPGVEALLRAPAELFDVDMMSRCELVQVSSDMWHVGDLGRSSSQLGAAYALALSASAFSDSLDVALPCGTLGRRLLELDDGAGSARVVPLAHRIGGGVPAELAVDAPPRSWSWSRQFQWCDATANCRFFWKFGACKKVDCDRAHVRISSSRMVDSVRPDVCWTRSQQVKWCKCNSVCWKNFVYNSCSSSVVCGLTHLGYGAFCSEAVDGVDVSGQRAGVAGNVALCVEDADEDAEVRGLVGKIAGGAMDVGAGLPIVQVFPDSADVDALRVCSSGSFSYSPHLVTSVMAIDCEMMTADRRTVSGRNVLGRVSVVNCYGQTVYDAFVYPEDCLVADTNQRWGSGISRVDIRPDRGAVAFSCARRVVLDLFSDSVLVGFSVHSDFKVLRVVPSDFPRGVVDVQRSPRWYSGRLSSLKSLVREYLGRDIQVAVGHSSVEDAAATMQLYIVAGPLVALSGRALPSRLRYMGVEQRAAACRGGDSDEVSDIFLHVYACDYGHALYVANSF